MPQFNPVPPGIRVRPDPCPPAVRQPSVVTPTARKKTNGTEVVTEFTTKAGGPSRTALKNLLKLLSANELRFLCGMFRLNRGGSKEELARTLVTSGYSVREIMGPATELAIGIFVEEYVPKSLWSGILQERHLASSGSRHELLLRLVENRLMDPRETLEALNPMQLRETYYALFDRVLTTTPNSAIAEILNTFGFDDTNYDTEEEVESGAASPAHADYDVALSFAGEDRATARKIGDELRAQGIRVFMDEYERTELWGKDLSDELRSRYGNRSRYVVLLVSRHYAVKDWTDFEFAVARREAGRRSEEFILPVRLDDTPLPGLRSTIAYLTLDELGVDGIVREILAKLGMSRD